MFLRHVERYWLIDMLEKYPFPPNGYPYRVLMSLFEYSMASSSLWTELVRRKTGDLALISRVSRKATFYWSIIDACSSPHVSRLRDKRSSITHGLYASRITQQYQSPGSETKRIARSGARL